MKKFITVIVVCLAFVPGFAQEVKTVITPKTSVVFPSQPTKTEQGPSTTYVVVGKDSAFVYTVALVDLEAVSGVTAEMMTLAMVDPSFWDQVEGGFIGSMGEGITKKKREIRTVNGKQAMYIEVEKKDGANTLDIATMIVMEGKNSINLVHINKKGKDAGRDKFFNSLETKE
jgi:hypothetical protein